MVLKNISVFLIKGGKNLAANIRKIKSLMEKASKKVIGREITVDTKIIRRHFHQESEHRDRWNMLYKKYLKARECTNIGQ